MKLLSVITFTILISYPGLNQNGRLVREITNPKLIPQVAHFIYFSGSCFGENNWVDDDILKNEFIQKGGIDESYADYIRVFKNKTEKN